MDSVDKLRARIYDSTLSNQTREDMERIADEIEAEIAERYMELPVDADGVPIRVGDHMEIEVATTEVVGIGPDYYITGERLAERQLRRDGWNFVHDSRHVKPRTLEDIIGEFGSLVAESASYPMLGDVRKYAAEIRELLGGDAE